MSIPHRGRTSHSTYFITANVLDKRSLFQVEKIARPFLTVMFEYREKKKYELHEFVLMPDHFHLILIPTGVTLERAIGQIKGGFSFQLNRSLRNKREPWQPGFVDRRIRDAEEYEAFRNHVWQNPVKRLLCRAPEEYLYSSANQAFQKHS